MMQWIKEKDSYDKTLVSAFQKDYQTLQKLLEEHKKDHNLHTHVARIAILLNDKKMFQMTDHYTRHILEEYAGNEDRLPFVVSCYKEAKYCGDIPSYVWQACTLKNAILLSETFQQAPDHYMLRDCVLEIQKHFDYQESDEEEQV